MFAQNYVFCGLKLGLENALIFNSDYKSLQRVYFCYHAVLSSGI